MAPRFVIDAVEQPWIPVAGSDSRFPVRRIFCVGRNYPDHALEMGHSPGREAPFFFMKAADSIVHDGAVLAFPPATSALHHEVELVVAVGQDGNDIPVGSALQHVWGYGVGLDMTRRDLQDLAKRLSRPWAMSKSFDGAAPVSALRAASESGHPNSGAITLRVDGQLRQKGDLSEQIWSVPEQLAHLSRLVTLRAGDVIFTGTPAGVGAVHRGSRLDAGIANVGKLHIAYCP